MDKRANGTLIKVAAIVIAAVIMAGYKLIFNKNSVFQEKVPDNLCGPYVCERIVDGDTYIIRIDGKREKVRALGIDTPESVATDKNEYKNCPEGEEASMFVAGLIEGEEVYLEYDVKDRDRFGRTLAYVYIDGEQIEEILLKKGYARTMTVPPNVKYADEYKEMQRIARENKTGFWKSNPYK